MKDFSEYIICSDYDGTLDFGGVCERNVYAINYFISHGGRFTLCTGRRGEGFYLGKKRDFEINAPIIGLTGAQIYDGATEKVVEQYCLEDNWAELVEDIIACIDYMQVLEFVGINETVKINTSDKDECRRVLHSWEKEKLYKITGYTDYNNSPIDSRLAEICFGKCNLTSNGYTTYEITRSGVDKGRGALKVKDLVGAKKLICVGDFLGDISMLKIADVSYAVENAIDEVKAVADKITVHAAKGAIAEIVEDIAGSKI
ncbi:MAG: hypothetical protein E7384_03055 [Ruminococcaceae bacterium]|nr:hypothetical protein [Oscillospiraceae bacterium]